MSVIDIDVNAILLDQIKEKDTAVNISVSVPKSIREKLIVATAKESEKRSKKVSVSYYIVEAVKEKLKNDGYL